MDDYEGYGEIEDAGQFPFALVSALIILIYIGSLA